MYSFLLSQVLRGTWFLRPEEAISGHVIINKLLSGEYNNEKFSKTLSETTPVLELSYEGESSYDKSPKGSTAIISVKGTMLKYGTFCSYGTEEIAGQIRSAILHPNISSIVLDIDSGGGSCDAVSPLCDAISESREKGKPIVACCDLAASAAYWVACNCDKIVASNDISSSFGSIGVMCSFADMKPFYERMGVMFHEIYADQSGNKNESFRLALTGDYTKIRQESLNPLAIRFQDEVKRRRTNLKTDVPGVLSGRMFYARESLEIGLIDDIGPISKAVQVAKKLEETVLINKYMKS